MTLPPLNLRLAVALIVAAAECAVSGAQSMALPKNSPFMPPAGAAGPTAAASETIEFAGVSSVGKRTDLIFHDKSTKKSHWVGIGETKEGIAVLTYDNRREQAVIKLNGVEKILTLRKGGAPTGAGAGPMPAPAGFHAAAPAPIASPVVFGPPTTAPVAPPAAVENPVSLAAKPAAPSIPETQLKQETEARMLVSDLLEIGMAQRRAYEEAQRKASDGTAPPPASPTPAPASPDKPNGG
jgi:hypothetical protein